MPLNPVGDVRLVDGVRRSHVRQGIRPAGPITFQSAKVVTEGLVKGHDDAFRGAPGRVVLSAHGPLDHIDQHLVEYDAVAGEHCLDGVRRLNAHYRVRGRLDTSDALMWRLAWARGHGFGDVADDMGQHVAKGEGTWGFHGGPAVVMLVCVRISNISGASRKHAV